MSGMIHTADRHVQYLPHTPSIRHDGVFTYTLHGYGYTCKRMCHHASWCRCCVGNSDFSLQYWGVGQHFTEAEMGFRLINTDSVSKPVGEVNLATAHSFFSIRPLLLLLLLKLGSISTITCPASSDSFYFHELESIATGASH
jgi:hypothetical protein